MKSTLKSRKKAKLVAMWACVAISAGVVASSAYGIGAVVNKSYNYKAEAVNQYRTEKLAELEESYANDKISDAYYTSEYTTISLRSDEDYLKNGMADGSEKVQALLKESNVGYWAFLPGFTVLLGATGLVLSVAGAGKTSAELEVL